MTFSTSSTAARDEDFDPNRKISVTKSGNTGDKVGIKSTRIKNKNQQNGPGPTQLQPSSGGANLLDDDLLGGGSNAGNGGIRTLQLHLVAEYYKILFRWVKITIYIFFKSSQY